MEHFKGIIKITFYFMKQFKLQKLTDSILKHMYKERKILQLTVVWGFLTALYSAHKTSGVSEESKFAFSFSPVGLNSLSALLN